MTIHPLRAVTGEDSSDRVHPIKRRQLGRVAVFFLRSEMEGVRGRKDRRGQGPAGEERRQRLQPEFARFDVVAPKAVLDLAALSHWRSFATAGIEQIDNLRRIRQVPRSWTSPVSSTSPFSASHFAGFFVTMPAACIVSLPHITFRGMKQPRNSLYPAVASSGPNVPQKVPPTFVILS